MENFETNWTEQELQTYLLLYCAHADFVITPEEKEYIQSLTSREEYKKIRREFEKDNDYQRIQKIDAAVERFSFSQDELNGIFENVKSLFLADGKIDLLERNIFRGLKHLLKIDSN